MPDDEPIVATNKLWLDHTPNGVALLSDVVNSSQKVVIPVIAAGIGFTVTTLVAKPTPSV
jgi:hypothetical protein